MCDKDRKKWICTRIFRFSVVQAFFSCTIRGGLIATSKIKKISVRSFNVERSKDELMNFWRQFNVDLRFGDSCDLCEVRPYTTISIKFSSVTNTLRLKRTICHILNNAKLTELQIIWPFIQKVKSFLQDIPIVKPRSIDLQNCSPWVYCDPLRENHYQIYLYLECSVNPVVLYWKREFLEASSNSISFSLLTFI